MRLTQDQVGSGPSVLERLFQHDGEVYGHILQEVFLCLDGATLRSLRLVSKSVKAFVDNRIWGNTRTRRILHKRLMDGWHGRLNSPSRESAFQCSDDVYDVKIRGDSIVCGLRNGTIELWNKNTLKKEMELTEQQGEVQVEANEDVVVGISTDSTVCVWDRKTGRIRDVLFHHRASVYGLALLPDGSIATGSMDGSIAIIDCGTLAVTRQFAAHVEGDWGVGDLDATDTDLFSASLSGHIRAWSLPACRLRLEIEAGHSVNCISVFGGVIASCSRTGRRQNGSGSNVVLWDADTGSALRRLDLLPSACYVKLDEDKLLALVSAGDAIIGEPHMLKWPIAKVLVLQRPARKKGNNEELKYWNYNECKSEILLRYQRTPAVTCTRTTLLYSQPRTKGMCSLVRHWS